MPGPQWSYAVSYTIPPFIGTAGAVTQVHPTQVVVNPVVTPPANRTYVMVDPNDATGVQVSGAVVMNIQIGDGTANQFFPVGLAVQPQQNVARPPATLFPQAAVSGNTITLSDNDSPGAPANYEFVVLFQDSNGYFGTLDPRIGNM